MYQQQNYNGYYSQRNNMPSISLKGHPVTSLEEARATAIDFDGTTFYFPDVANSCIYTKQINMDGTVLLNKYSLDTIPEPTPPTDNNYVTRQEFESCINTLKESLLNKKEVFEF